MSDDSTPQTITKRAGWPKGKPRGAQKPEHKVKRGAAISAGQHARFSSAEARSGMAKSITECWHNGARAHEFIDCRTRRMSVSVSEVDWAFLHLMSQDCGEPVSVIIRAAISDARKACEEVLKDEDLIPAWASKWKGRGTLS